MTIFVLLILLLVLLVAFILVRNQRVYRYRSEMADTIFSASVWDYKWRLSIMDSVTYNDMMLQFWKPLDRFYPDKSFLDLNDVRGHAPWEKTA
jgi:hypothetical protein